MTGSESWAYLWVALRHTRPDLQQRLARQLRKSRRKAPVTSAQFEASDTSDDEVESDHEADIIISDGKNGENNLLHKSTKNPNGIVNRVY